MEQIKSHIKGIYHLSNYQLAQASFLFKTIASEISKILIMGILFHSQLPLIIFAFSVMLCLRGSTGIGCLATSALYLWLAIYILPHNTIN